MAKAVCSQLLQDLVSVVPQFDDFACPLCYEIEWRPVKLVCGHLMCISCAVNMQQLHNRQCPFCRRRGIMALDERNIDSKLENYLEKHFPKEVKVKRIKVETERGKQQVCLYMYSKNVSRLLRHSPEAETNSYPFYSLARTMYTHLSGSGIINVL